MSKRILIFSAHFACFLLLGALFYLLDVRPETEEIDTLFSKYPPEIMFLAVVIMAPPAETIFLNALPIFLLKKLTKNRYLNILLSSFVFSLAHTYGNIYMTLAYFSGLVLNHYYFNVEQRSGTIIAVLSVTLLHMVYNLFVFIVKIHSGVG